MAKKSVRVLATFTDPRMGGPQRRSLNIATRLKRRGIETVFLIPTGDDAFDNAAADAGFETHRITLSRLRPPTNLLGNARFFVDFVPTIQQISSLINDRDVDIVHANMVVNFQTVLATARTSIPLAWHFNDTLTPTPVKQIAAYLGRRWADEIVVAADAVHDYYFDSQTVSRTIYAPVDLEKFDPEQMDLDESAIRSKLDFPVDIPLVGTVGNLNPIKGHEYLLHAASKVIDNGQEIAVPIVGAELDSRQSYAEKLRSLRSELGLEDQVTFVGFRSDIPELLSLFDVFVLPSVAEACPIAVLEAMAMKCPVVATAVGGVPEEIPDDDHGWLVPPKDSTVLARAIRDVLENPIEAERRAENARSRVESTFSLTACVDRHEDLYRSLVEE